MVIQDVIFYGSQNGRGKGILHGEENGGGVEASESQNFETLPTALNVFCDGLQCRVMSEN